MTCICLGSASTRKTWPSARRFITTPPDQDRKQRLALQRGFSESRRQRTGGSGSSSTQKDGKMVDFRTDTVSRSSGYKTKGTNENVRLNWIS